MYLFRLYQFCLFKGNGNQIYLQIHRVKYLFDSNNNVHINGLNEKSDFDEFS